MKYEIEYKSLFKGLNEKIADIKIKDQGILSQIGNINYYYRVISDKKEKIEKAAIRVPNGNTHTEEEKSFPIEKETVSKDIEEIPVLAKLAEKNFKTPLILPSCTQWFRFDDIHEIETKALPEFFCNKYPSKTPEVYKEYRNYIINLYRENSSTYLTATSKLD